MKAFQVFETLKEWEHYLVGKESVLYSIVLRPGPMAGPVRGPGFGFWRDHRVGRVNSLFLKKSKRRHFSKKKKQKSTGCNRFLTRFCRVSRVNLPGHPSHTESWLFLFFFQPDPVPVPGRSGPGSTRRVGPGFKTIAFTASKRLISIKMLILQCKMKCLIK